MVLKEECKSLSDLELIKMIAEDSDYLSCVYNKTREYSIRFLQNQCSGDHYNETIEEIFHDAIMEFFKKCKANNLILTCSIQTYVNSICRNKLLDIFKKDGRKPKIIEIEDEEHFGFIDEIKDWLHSPENSINDKEEIIMKGFKDFELNQKNKKCHDLIFMVLNTQKMMKDIADIFGWSNEQVARNEFYKCKERFRRFCPAIK